MKLSGIIMELDLTQKERTIKIHLRDVAKVLWVNPEHQDKVKNLELGQHVNFEVREGRDYYFYQSHEERAASPEATKCTALQPSAEQPPKPYTPTKDKGLPPTPGKGRACSARFMAKFRDLVKQGLTTEALVNELCLQEREIQQLKQALDVKEAIEQRAQSIAVKVDTDFDRIRPTHYIQLARVPDEKKQLELACKVAEEDLSVRELKREIEGPKPPEPPREEEIDQNFPITCKTCGLNFHLVHVRQAKHRLEEVMVAEKT